LIAVAGRSLLGESKSGAAAVMLLSVRWILGYMVHVQISNINVEDIGECSRHEAARTRKMYVYQRHVVLAVGEPLALA
jgi:hypothetical protein